MDREMELKREPTSRVQGVNIDAKIHWLTRAYTIFDFFDYPLGPNRVNRTSFDDFKAAIAVVFVIAETG